MFVLNRNYEVDKLISITKSNSGISGPELARAHMRLGELLSHNMEFPADDTTVVAIMRGGIFFAEGLYFGLGCRFMTYDPKHEEFVCPQTKHVILVDSVINTGKTIKEILKPTMTLACCVINEKVVPLFDEQLFTVRVSANSYIGSEVVKQQGGVGPDTTMRLFNYI